MTDDSARAALADRVRQEHEELRELLADVHKVLAARLAQVADVAEQLQSLCDHVETHFTEEEEGGFFNDVVQCAPRYSHHADELRTEHKSLLEAVRRLHDAATHGDGSTDWWQQLADSFHDFSKHLMQHESAENEMLQQVYNEDIGSAD